MLIGTGAGGVSALIKYSAVALCLLSGVLCAQDADIKEHSEDSANPMIAPRDSYRPIDTIKTGSETVELLNDTQQSGSERASMADAVPKSECLSAAAGSSKMAMSATDEEEFLREHGDSWWFIALVCFFCVIILLGGLALFCAPCLGMAAVFWCCSRREVDDYSARSQKPHGGRLV
ncbi:hypothetical protein PAPHI01_2394 [Pancytospora philotis]|nr:hypothetical protein PAPHI01_2394 [Pancytospora philotis]